MLAARNTLRVVQTIKWSRKFNKGKFLFFIFSIAILHFCLLPSRQSTSAKISLFLLFRTSGAEIKVSMHFDPCRLGSRLMGAC